MAPFGLSCFGKSGFGASDDTNGAVGTVLLGTYWIFTIRLEVLSNAGFQEIIAGTRVAWIVGRIEYFDGSNRPHHTLVCCRWDQGRSVFVPDEQGNDAD